MSPMKEKNWGGARAKSPALPCGVVDEPAKAGGTAVLTALQASSLQRHAHHAGSRLTWVNIGSTSHPPSRATQGPRFLSDPIGNGFRVQGSTFSVRSGFWVQRSGWKP